MQYSALLVAAVAVASANAAKFTNSAFNGVTAGQSFTLTWSDASGPVTILLKSGPSTNLVTVATVTSGSSGESFTYNVPSTLPSNTYAFEIDDSTGPNYSSQFQLIGGAAAASSSLSSALSSASSSASSVVSSLSSSASSAASALSSSISSGLSTITANTTSTSAPSTTAATTPFSNSTTTTGSHSSGATTTVSKTSTGSSPSGTSSGSTPSSTAPNANSASEFASPLALVFLTFAAVLSFN